MAHLVEKMAYTNEVPWHGLGAKLTPGTDIATWQYEAGLDWEALTTPVRYQRALVGPDGTPQTEERESGNDRVLYRSDTGDVLGVHTTRYQPVQPREVIEFYRDLTQQHGFELETAGCLKDGKRIWALANTKNAWRLRGKDDVKGYLLLATGFDGSLSTTARFTNVRVVCNNTLTIATDGKAEVCIPHSTKFDADAVKLQLNVGDVWERHTQQLETMSQRLVSRDETVRYFLDVYYGLDTDEKIRAHAEAEKASGQKRMEKFTERLTHALFNSPGAHLAAAKGTLWGALNAVTYDLDHTAPARSQENRLNSAWFGSGSALKKRAWEKAEEMLA